MSNNEFYIEDQLWSEKLQNEFEEYLYQCEMSVEYEEEEGTEPFETLSGEPFCGCSTCYTREQLFFLTPKIIKAYKNGQVVLTEDEEK
jgi:hypothetical protein